MPVLPNLPDRLQPLTDDLVFLKPPTQEVGGWVPFVTLAGLGFASTALATTATSGHIYFPTCAGTPTGVPAAFTGRAAAVYDTTANKLWIYNGSWRSVALT